MIIKEVSPERYFELTLSEEEVRIIVWLSDHYEKGNGHRNGGRKGSQLATAIRRGVS